MFGCDRYYGCREGMVTFICSHISSDVCVRIIKVEQAGGGEYMGRSGETCLSSEARTDFFTLRITVDKFSMVLIQVLQSGWWWWKN